MDIIPYTRLLKPYSRELRKNLTTHEKILWKHIRNKKIQGVQFYRQKIIGSFILDFYSNEPPLAIELDGIQHSSSEHEEKDKNRDSYLQAIGIFTLRFNNVEITSELDDVLQLINKTLLELKEK